MATIKATLRPPKDQNGKKTIYIRISDKGKTRYISTGEKIKPKHWNKNKGEARSNDEFDAIHLNQIISDKIKEINNQAYKLKANHQIVNADILKRKTTNKGQGDFIEYAELFAKRKHQTNVQTGRRYDGIVSKVREFCGGELKFRDITVTWLKMFSDWLSTDRKNSANTIHSNLRAVRAILYSAIEEDLFAQEKNPFFKFKLKQPKVKKTKLTSEEIKKIANTKPNGNPVQSIAKDMFLFSFFTCGMRYRDIVLLKWNNIEDDYIRYTMNKTGQPVSIMISKPAKNILMKYQKTEAAPEFFIFPILNTNRNLVNSRILDREISSKNAYLNKELSKLAKAAGISKSVSMHVARHTFSAIAYNQGADIYSISNSLGHSSIKTTENYLQSLNYVTTDNTLDKVYQEF